MFENGVDEGESPAECEVIEVEFVHYPTADDSEGAPRLSAEIAQGLTAYCVGTEIDRPLTVAGVIHEPMLVVRLDPLSDRCQAWACPAGGEGCPPPHGQASPVGAQGAWGLGQRGRGRSRKGPFGPTSVAVPVQPSNVYRSARNVG